jgi:hypothetical protein
MDKLMKSQTGQLEGFPTICLDGLTEVENSKTFVPSVRGLDTPFTAGEEFTRRTARAMLPISISYNFVELLGLSVCGETFFGQNILHRAVNISRGTRRIQDGF